VDVVGKKRKKTVRCDPKECGMEMKVDKMMDKFSTVAEKLTENIQKLTDQGKFVEKLDQKIDRVESKVDKNSQMVWKMAGVGMAGVVIIPLLFQLFVK